MNEKILKPALMGLFFFIFFGIIYFFIPNVFFAGFGALILLVLIK